MLRRAARRLRYGSFIRAQMSVGAITRKSAHADLTSLLALDHFENGGKTRAYLVIPDQRRVLPGMA